MKLTVKTATEIFAALQNLDLYTKIVKNEKGEEQIVRLPYEFSGKIRWNLVKNLKKFQQINDDFIKAKDGLIKEISGGSGMIKPEETEKIGRFNDKLEEILAQEVELPGALSMKIQDIDLDKNPIPVAILNLLSPILDDSEA